MSTRAEPSVPLGNKPGKTNWVEKYHALPKGSWIRRAAEHIKAKGRPDSEAIPFAVNAARRICRSGDTNLPGLQQVAPAKRADACAAVAIWDAAAARAKAAKDLSADGYRAIDLAGARLARGLDLTDQQREVVDLAFDEAKHARGKGGKWIHIGAQVGNTPKKTTASDYLNEKVNFGGEWMTRAQVYKWFKDNGHPQRAAEMWLMGHDAGKRARSNLPKRVNRPAMTR